MSGKQAKELRLEAIERYQAGESATAICRALGKSRGWLYKWLQRKERSLDLIPVPRKLTIEHRSKLKQQ